MSRICFRHPAFTSSACIKTKESSAKRRLEIEGASRHTLTPIKFWHVLWYLLLPARGEEYEFKSSP
jgi:hypothetical protein